MHKTTGRWHLGIILALCTSILWGLLPIALKALLTSMDANTVTWYRFLTAAACIMIYLLVYIRASHIPSITPALICLICIAILGLTSNYIFYLKGLQYSDSNTTQIVIQLAPILLLFGGIIIFKESFNISQWIGVLIFGIGMLLFFNLKFSNIQNVSLEYAIGIVLVVIASFTWAAYALAQKQLLSYFSSNQIMFYIYTAGAIIFLPLAKPQQILNLNQFNSVLLAFCCANTLLAYGCFAESLKHLEASRVSAVLAITPILTITFNYLAFLWFPAAIEVPRINLLAILGACLMVAGSIVTVFKKESTQER